MDLAALGSDLARHGLDVFAAGPLGAYHAAVPEAFRLPLADTSTIALVGASRALWTHFRQALRADPRRAAAAHPVDGWAAPLIEAIVARHVPEPHDVLHYQEPPPRRVALQHLAEVLGVAGRAPCGLAIHPTLGPWLSLRAAVVIDAPAPPRPPVPVYPCATCAERPCVPPFERALAAVRASATGSVRDEPALWVAVRDACPIGRAARYTDPQVRWHHAHDRRALEEESG